MNQDKAAKDLWDKTEILAKATAAVLVPLAAAVALYLWNSERTRQQSVAVILPLAVSVLTSQPNSDDSPNLRAWTLEVVNDPSNPPRLDDVASRQLSTIRRRNPDLPQSLLEPCADPAFLMEDVPETVGELAEYLLKLAFELESCEDKRDAIADIYDIYAAP